MKVIFQVLAALTVLLTANPVAAQTGYPNRQVRIIVGFTPGTAPDVAARLLAAKFSDSWGVPVTVEDVTGAGSNIATDRVAKSSPDGYTLLMGGNPSLVINPSLYDKLPFDPMTFAHITRLVRMPLILAVRNDLPAKTLPEFMTLAKSTEIRWASGGVGTSQHLAGEYFAQMSGLKMIHVPYRGTGPALNDLSAGIVDAYFGDPATLGVIKGGKARAMAVTSPERWPVLPDAPALAEAVPGYEAWNWYGIDAPPGTPDAIVDLLATAIRKVMADPAVKQKYDDNGLHPATLSREEYAAFIKHDAEVWGKVIRTGNIKPEDS